MGFPEDPDQNHPDSTGIASRPLNNIDGVRMSTSLTYLNLARHRLNLTIRGSVTAHRVVFDGKRAVGVEADSGDQTFTVEGDQIILTSGAVGSPQILMLSGVGPAAPLASLGITSVHICLSPQLIRRLAELDLTIGLKQLLEEEHDLLEVPIEDPGVRSDIDTPEDYENLGGRKLP